LSTHLSVQVRNLLLHGDLLRGRSLPLHIVRQNMDGAEIEFSNLLVEDTNNDAMSYIDCKLVTLKATMRYLTSGGRFMLCAQTNQSSSKSFRNSLVAYLYMFS
jgi:protein transport protein SEC24